MIEYPSLEIRNADRLAADAIGRVSGGVTTEVVEAQIAARRELLKLIEGGLEEPICPELTNANPSSPHTVMLEAFAWVLDQQAYRINQVPKQNLIAFANLLGIEQRPATAAVTVLRFTVDPPPSTPTVIPAGTTVSTADGRYVFETIEELTIAADAEDLGEVEAVRTVAGHTLLQPDVLTLLVDTPAYVETVTNPNAVDSGTEIESLDSVLERVRRYARRGERIVSTKDLEDAIRDEALQGTGVVRAWPFIKNGDFQNKRLVGHTSVIVMTKTGDVVDAPTRRRINAVTDTAVGNQFIYVVDPSFVEFDIEANVKLNSGSPEGEVLTAIERNLRAFYTAAKEQFGRPILRSEIIAVIEGTEGVDRIVAAEPSILISPTADVRLVEYQMPKLGDVTMNVVE
jgi:uncharacterized phage protein gp47/JayE